MTHSLYSILVLALTASTYVARDASYEVDSLLIWKTAADVILIPPKILKEHTDILGKIHQRVR